MLFPTAGNFPLYYKITAILSIFPREAAVPGLNPGAVFDIDAVIS